MPARHAVAIVNNENRMVIQDEVTRRDKMFRSAFLSRPVARGIVLASPRNHVPSYRYWNANFSFSWKYVEAVEVEMSRILC